MGGGCVWKLIDGVPGMAHACTRHAALCRCMGSVLLCACVPPDGVRCPAQPRNVPTGGVPELCAVRGWGGDPDPHRGIPGHPLAVRVAPLHPVPGELAPPLAPIAPAHGAAASWSGPHHLRTCVSVHTCPCWACMPVHSGPRAILCRWSGVASQPVLMGVGCGVWACCRPSCPAGTRP